MRTRFIVTIIGILIPFSVALAEQFRDVPKDHPYATEIYGLQKLGVFTGDTNPDGTPKGTARPEDPLQRDELLALTYRANDEEVRNIYNNCFPDVAGLWSESIICTAKHNGDVQGYPDGTFGASNHVNNVETLKIVLTTLGFAIPKMTLKNQVGIDYKNVNVKSWYAPYLLAGVLHGLIPPEQTEDNDYRPEDKTTRAQAAYIIYHASMIPEEDRLKLPTEEDTEDEDEETEDDESSSSSSSSETNNDEEVTPTGATLADFPLHRTGQTGERGTTAFAFDLSEPGTVLVEAVNLTSASTGIGCFLYLLGESGFSHEFFVGYEEGGSCTIRAALRAGKYQVEVRSRSEGAEYSLDVAPSEGDGNDGFIEAVSLRVGSPKTSTLIGNDFEDWYRFRVGSTQSHRVKLTSAHNLSCAIYPAEDVDLFGFEGPSCGKTYEYPSGTYYVSVKKTEEAAGSQTYTVELR